jgi:DNA-binding transcriptional LysR family regulator
MRRDHLGDLTAFLAVAQERSFTRAASKLGTSQSALSHIVRRLEAGLGVRLLTRNTRSVVPTEAGERLMAIVEPALGEIEEGLSQLSELRDKPAGTVRITAIDHAAEQVLWPILSKLMRDYPDINIEISVDTALVDIVAERFDAGVRFGDSIAKDMIAVRIGPDIRFVMVASPAYFEKHGRPRTPNDLAHHQCINMRLPTLGGIYAWELEKDGRETRVRVDGRLVFNSVPMVIQAAVDGFGIAYCQLDRVADLIAEGKLEWILDDWCPPFPGYHLYYPSRRQQSPAFALIVQALRYPRAGRAE